MALLEVALSDFANLEADTKASEAEAVKSYEALMVETKKSKAVKSKKIEMDQADRAAAESKLQEDIAELKSTQDELIAALATSDIHLDAKDQDGEQVLCVDLH